MGQESVKKTSRPGLHKSRSLGLLCD